MRRYGAMSRKGATTVRLRTLGVRANGALDAVMPCTMEERVPARLTPSRIRLKP
jgi:hypothetical protein